MAWGCVALLLLALLAGALARTWLRPSGPVVAWTHDAYIWQLQWKDSLRAAIQDHRDSVRAWRVLWAQVRGDGTVRPVQVDAAALQASGRPVVVVVRIEGQLEQFDAATLQRQALDALGRARASGLLVVGLEIDHDCATAKLPRYTLFLQGLRQVMGGHAALAITALPAWLSSADLPALLTLVDHAVLQVHAVQNPSLGLFDRARAVRWAQAFNTLSPVPFRVALPTYGSRVHFDSLGNYTAVESEAPSLKGPASGTELIVSPQDVAAFLADPALAHLDKLEGFAWFRLPTADDQRAWHANTWRALLTGAPLHAQADLQAVPSAQPQLFDLFLRNTGSTDLPWPTQIDLPRYCTELDGSQGYVAVPPAVGGPRLKNTQARLLAPQRSVHIGWAHCTTSPEKDWHVIP